MQKEGTQQQHTAACPAHFVTTNSQNCWVEESLAPQQNDNRSSRHYPNTCPFAEHITRSRAIGGLSALRHTQQLIETELDRKTRVYASASITHRWDASMGGLLAGPASERKIPPSSSLPAAKIKMKSIHVGPGEKGEYRERYFVLSEQLHFAFCICICILHFAFCISAFRRAWRVVWCHRQHDGVSPLSPPPPPWP